MRERGIILSPWEVRAFLDGRKQRLTRPVRHQGGPVHQNRDGGAWHRLHDGLWYWGRDIISGAWSPLGFGVRPPFDLGDRLWGRETWATYANHDARKPGTAFYAATEPQAATPDNPRWGGRWRSPVTMPRWASRILLDVTEVRAQRVQDITDIEAFAEGVDRTAYGCHQHKRGGHGCVTGRQALASLWDRIYGAGAWDRNDWVFAATVKRLEVDRED